MLVGWVVDNFHLEETDQMCNTCCICNGPTAYIEHVWALALLIARLFMPDCVWEIQCLFQVFLILNVIVSHSTSRSRFQQHNVIYMLFHWPKEPIAKTSRGGGADYENNNIVFKNEEVQTIGVVLTAM